MYVKRLPFVEMPMGLGVPMDQGEGPIGLAGPISQPRGTIDTVSLMLDHTYVRFLSQLYFGLLRVSCTNQEGAA